MARKKRTSATTTTRPHGAFPYRLFLPFVLCVAASLVYVAPQEVPKLSMAVVKCLPILSLMVVILQKESLKGGGEVALVFIGLGLSLFGDYYLIWPDETFLEGLVSFVVAESFYITSHGFKKVSWRSGVLVYSLCLFSLTVVYNFLPTPVHKIAVTFYSFSLGTMLWRTIDRAWLRRDIPWGRRVCSAGGATALVVSDFCIGTLQFGRLVPHALAQLTILSTYYLAQLLIVLGACGRLWRA
ncbi:lysoplasmalogenase TMEM86B-like [Scylla paramamosain]|uniref:lysoplasmalogenase TMEM86B-like n=1 Tax=Scylla paramamosain TaxID=85552 RepID=UPI003083CB8F